MKNWRRVAVLLAAALGILYFGWLADRPSVSPFRKALDIDFNRIFTRAYFHLGGMPITPILMIKLIVFLLLLAVGARRVRAFVQNKLLIHTSMDLGQRDALAHLTYYLIIAFGLIIGLESLGVNLGSLLVLGGAVGIGVGLGLQNVANNFVSGLILLLERPVKLGDRVEVGGTNGDVVRIAGRSTWVRTNDNVVMIIPNSEFISSRVTNWTANDRQVRFTVPVGVAYDCDPEEVRQVLLDVGAAHPDVLRDPPPEVRFQGFGESSLNFELMVWTIKQVQTPKLLTSDLNFAIFRAFREHSIEIPFPQRDVYLKAVPAGMLSEPAKPEMQ